MYAIRVRDRGKLPPKIGGNLLAQINVHNFGVFIPRLTSDVVAKPIHNVVAIDNGVVVQSRPNPIDGLVLNILQLFAIGLKHLDKERGLRLKGIVNGLDNFLGKSCLLHGSLLLSSEDEPAAD